MDACPCVQVRDGCFILMASLWAAYWVDKSPITWTIIAVAFGIGVMRLRTGIRQSLVDGDSVEPVPTLLVLGVCVMALWNGWNLFLPPLLIKGFYVSVVAACYGNLMLYSTARLRRERIKRKAETPRPELTDASDAEALVRYLGRNIGRRAVRSTLHPDRGSTDQERLLLTRLFQMAEQVFDRMGVK